MKNRYSNVQKPYSPASCPGLTDRRGKRGRILLLQGPVGPFFRDLTAVALRRGYSVDRYAFHPADRIWIDTPSKDFHGSKEDWREELCRIFSEKSFDAVIAFGSSRPAHVIAREICEAQDIRFLSLEEGYIRPGFITAEWGGNNADSPLAKALSLHPTPGPVPRGRNYEGFGAMARQAALYYTVRGIFASHIERKLFHREIDLIPEARGWARNFWKSAWHSKRDIETCQDLIKNHKYRYFLVPLQVSTDANLQGAACGWTVRRLVDATIASFARTAPPDVRLVFKIHPMARGHGRMGREIRSVARGNGVGGRVDVLETGQLGGLARSCAGMITINSTSGLSALSHGRPLLAVGQSIYAHPELATCAQGRPDFDAFWSGGMTAPEVLRRSFLAQIAREALLPGDFYARRGRRVAARAVLDKIVCETPMQVRN
jgi:capsular polysaccharide export protein